jgi:predicted nucleic acid-binding protein
MGKNLLLQDACVLINLLATDRLEEIARHLAYQFAIASSVAAETIYLRRPEDKSREQADLRTHVTSGLIKVLDVETELEQSRYLYYATELDDGEAMSLALAECRRLEIATDDRKARRMVAAEGLSIKLWSTVDILKAWERIGSISPQEVKDTLTKISSRARFRPKGCAWWDKRLAL